MIPSFLMNKLYSIEFLNNHTKNSLIKAFLPDKIQFNKLPTYLSNKELSLLDKNNPVKVGFKNTDKGKKVRINKSNGKVIK